MAIFWYILALIASLALWFEGLLPTGIMALVALLPFLWVGAVVLLGLVVYWLRLNR